MDQAKSVRVRKDISGQVVAALKDAKFPINSPQELLNAFPNGADTTCQSGNVKMTAGEAGKILKASDFPFKSAEHVARTILNRAGI